MALLELESEKEEMELGPAQRDGAVPMAQEE